MAEVEYNGHNNKYSQGKNKINRAVAYYADEILDAWLNIGKHQKDIPLKEFGWRSWQNK